MADNQISPDKLLAVTLRKHLPQISRSAVPGLDTDRLMQLVVNCCEKNPYLYKCSPNSLLRAAFQSAEVGLDLATSLNHAYLVPRTVSGNLIAVFSPSAYGLADLSYRSGLVKAIWWHPVFEGDEFSYNLGDSPHIDHTPAEEFEDYDHLTHVYACAELMTGGKIRRVLTKKQIEKRRLMNEAEKQGKYSPWRDWGVEMACVKGVRALCTLLPRSKELTKAMSFVDAEESGIITLQDSEIKDMSEEPKGTRADRVADRLGVEKIVKPPANADELEAERQRQEQEGLGV